MQNGNNRNAYIELCRFVGAIMIMLHHTSLLGGSAVAPDAWIFVEFFFILSGYFTTKHFDVYNKNDEKLIVGYVIKKGIRLVPYAWIGILIDLIAKIGLGKITVYNISQIILELPMNLLFMKVFPFLHFDLNSTLWFVSGLLYIMPIVITIQIYIKTLYKYLICWLLPLFMYSSIIMINGRIQYWGVHWQINGILRAAAGLMLGSFCFYLSEWFKKILIKPKMKKYIDIVELLLLLALVINPIVGGCSDCEMAFVFLCVFMLMLMCSGQDRIQKKIPSKAVYLGKISIPLYCIHAPVYNTIFLICGNRMRFEIKIMIAFAAVFIIAVVLMILFNKIKLTGRLNVLYIDNTIS